MYREPTAQELISPLFNAIWDEIKTWDINVPDQYLGHCGATGNHVCAIMDAIDRHIVGVRAEAIGWAHADACVTLDNGGDPRQTNCGEQLQRAMIDLA